MLCKKYYIICIYLILYTNPLLYCLKAFKLLVDGGQHPRGKTSVNVIGIGHDALLGMILVEIMVLTWEVNDIDFICFVVKGYLLMILLMGYIYLNLLKPLLLVLFLDVV